ncbi:class I SAM-dependent methyltransferase [Nitrosophilus alvini]|uniref:class I SAM-dependent methyltransferase n=1 Tax=Nitrosophilus alvini TaxID=2714855 RepID=UPI00190C2654|nr:class I SAM-dependent methyltransferase [Nitrosophilus alvini]
MINDKTRWNEKYLKNPPVSEEAIETLKKFYHLSSGNKALDIACGFGRNAKFLAKVGFLVDAVDISDVALEKLSKTENINTIVADLDEYEIPKKSYDLIVCSYYLNRRLFPFIKEGLKPGGVVIYETFLLSENIKPFKEEYLLRVNELLGLFYDFHIIYYEEKEIVREDGKHVPVASIAARSRTCS